LLLLIVAPDTASPQAAPPPAPGVSEGQKIGTIIKTAISTAAPGISSILSLVDTIFANRSNTNSNKATLPELQAAAKTAPVQTAAKETVQKPTVAAQQAIQPIGKVSDELAVIGRFLSPSVTATQYLIVIKTKMTEKTTDWVGITNTWELAKTQIGKLKAVPDADLNKVRDAYLRLKLTDIRDANDTTVISISQEVTQKNLSDLKSDLPTLMLTLANMTAVAGYELAELQADIGDLAVWAKGAAAGSASIPKRAPYKNFLDANVR